MLRARMSLRAILVLTLCAIPLFASPTITAGLFADGDGEIPGVATTSPAEGTFAGLADAHDVFQVRILEGESFHAAMSFDGNADADMDLYAPGSATLATAVGVANAELSEHAFPLQLSSLVSETGTYYLDVSNVLEDEDQRVGYTLRFTTDWPGDRGEIPGASLRESPFTGALESEIDPDDVYNVRLEAGEQLDLTLDGAADADFDLRLFAPGTSSVNHVEEAVASSGESGSVERIQYTARVSGTYYVSLYTCSGSGSYRITWAKKAAVSTPAVASSMALGKTYTATGSLSLKKAAPKSVARVQAYRLEGRKWVLRATKMASLTQSAGRVRYSAKIRLPLRGKWRVRATQKDAVHATAYSAYRYVTVK